MPIINIFPIHWFGDREAYQKSEIKIVTVGLNPSDMEFRNRKGDPFSSKYRFPSYNGNVVSITSALNEYFKKNPYNSWFQSFEHILNGLDASYYDSNDFKNRALHTDICTSWATTPTWSKLSKTEQKNLMSKGFKEWKDLVRILEPDIILFSIPQQYINMLNITTHTFETIIDDKNGNKRKKPIVIRQGRYGNAIAIFGRTWNLPFGALGASQKRKLGQDIKGLIQKSIKNP